MSTDKEYDMLSPEDREAFDREQKAREAEAQAGMHSA